MSEQININKLFRENALKGLHSEDELQASLKIIKPGSWIIILILILLFVLVLVWGLMAKLEMSVSGSGILLSMQQFQHAEKMMLDNRNEHHARLDQMKIILENKRKLYKQHYLSLIDMEKAEQEFLAAKYNSITDKKFNPDEPIFGSLTNKHEDLYSLIFVKTKEGKKIRKGMTAYLLPNIFSEYEYGYIKGEVLDVSRYPASKEVVYSYLGNINLVDEFFYEGSPFLVKIKLKRNTKTNNGYAWTTNNGPQFDLDAGTTVTAKIIYQTSSPVNLFIH